MGLLDWLNPKPSPKPDREAQAKEHFGGTNSVFRNRTAAGPPDTDALWRESRAAEARRAKAAEPPKTRTPQQKADLAAARSGNYTNVVGPRPNAQGTPTKEEELGAARSGNFSNVTSPKRVPQQGDGAVLTGVTIERPPNAVLQALNEVGFTVDAPTNSAGMPTSSFSSTKKLADHVYRVSNIEDEYLRESFNLPTTIKGGGGGSITAPTTPVDQALPVMHMEPQESAALTWDAYASLNDQQKAAVDWNTLLIEAREKDFSDSVKIATPEEQAAYDAEVTRLFGEQGGSNRYAPNTMKLLEQLDVVQLGQDLDEYLSLERALDDKQIAEFKFTDKDIATLDTLAGTEAEQLSSYAATRTGGNIANLNSANVQAASDMIKMQLANPEANTSSFDSLMYGNSTAGVVPLGFGDSTTDQAFQQALLILGSEDVTQYGIPADADPLAFLLDDLAAQGADAQMQSQFLEYVGQQSQLFGQYGTEDQKTMAALVSKRSGLGG